MILLINKITHFIELLKWNPLILSLIRTLNTMLILMKKILSFKLVIMLEYENTKTFLLKDILQIGHKILWSVKLKIQFHGRVLSFVINDLNGEDIADTFYVKELRKTNQKEFRIERWLKEKETNYMSNGKIMIIHLIAELIKTILYKNELILFQTIWTFWRRY